MSDPSVTPRDESAEFESRGAAASRLALAIAAGRMAVWDYDLATDSLTGSPELYRLLGLPSDARPTTEEIRARYYPGERERLQAEGRLALARGERYVESEFRCLWPDGAVRWVLLRAEAVMGAGGRPVRAVGVVMDITNRKRAEEALRAEQARLKLAQDAAGLGVWDWDLNSGRTTWSPEVFDLLGLDASGGSPPSVGAWLRAIHPEDRKVASAAVRQAVRQGIAFAIDFRLRRDRGASERWIRSQGAPVPCEGGAPSRFVGVNLEVTDEHRREQRLLVIADDFRVAAARAEREREHIAELSNDLFAAVGAADEITAHNTAWSRLFGESARDLRGRPFLGLCLAEDRAEAEAALAGVRGGDRLRRFEARMDPSGSGVTWVAWTLAAEGGSAFAVGRDVTLDKARDAALAQAQKMEALGQLTGGVAHDFNNLLQAVSGYLELIRRKPGDEARVAHWADNALLASERGTKLTGQLLAFSRAQRIEVEAVSVTAVLSGLEDILERTLGAAVTIGIEMPAEALGVLVDRTQLETALINMAVNARDAMPAGGRLTIAAALAAAASAAPLPPDDYVEISVRDTGTGMPANVASRAFDPFFTTKGVGKGTGLGLSQVYGMARHAGGTARIVSRLGEGTTVSLLLRRVAPPDDDVSGGEPGLGDGLATVLVVDDDPEVRTLLADMLPTLGYAALFAADGPAALLALEQVAPAAVIADFAMPGMNGAEFAGAALARDPGLKILFASGYADTGQIAEAVGPGAVLIRKPFRMGTLAGALSRILERAPGR